MSHATKTAPVAKYKTGMLMRTETRLNSWGVFVVSVLLLMKEHTLSSTSNIIIKKKQNIKCSFCVVFLVHFLFVEVQAFQEMSNCIVCEEVCLSVWPFPPQVCTGPLMLLNELMMPLEMGFKGASAGNGITCAVYRGQFPSHNPAQPAPCALVDKSLDPETVCRVERLGPLYGIRLCWKEAPRGIRRYTSRPELIELSGFRGYQSPLISCHISIRVCFDFCLWHKHFT